MEKEPIKVKLLTVCLIIALIVIGVMGYFIYEFYNKKEIAVSEITDLKSKISSLDNTIESIKNENTTTNDKQKEDTKVNDEQNEINKKNEQLYNSNFASSVFKKLDKKATIVIPIWAYSGYSNITINSKHQAYWNNQANDTFPETSNNKVAENVINAWYCPLGQDIESNACLLFLKKDGSVTYIRFYLDKDSSGNSFVNCSKEKKLSGISNISNVLIVENGFYGAIFVKEDGTTMNLDCTKLDELTKQNLK